MSDFSNKIINLRERHDWSKTYVAERLSLKNMQTYANWEYGKSEPDSEMLVKLANLFDVSTDYLLGNADSNNNLKTSDETYDSDLAEFLERNQGAMSYGGEDLSDDDLEKLDVALKIVFDKYRKKK